MRHAKAEHFGETDHARALEKRGRRDAEAAGAWLARQEIEPDYALVSSALRTVETWKAVADAADWDVEPDVESALYDAGPESALDVIRAVPEDSHTVVFIGHNPTAGFLAQLLDDGTGDEESADALARGFPPATLALLEFDGTWEELELGSARLTGLHRPSN